MAGWLRTQRRENGVICDVMGVSCLLNQAAGCAKHQNLFKNVVAGADN